MLFTQVNINSINKASLNISPKLSTISSKTTLLAKNFYWIVSVRYTGGKDLGKKALETAANAVPKAPASSSLGHIPGTTPQAGSSGTITTNVTGPSHKAPMTPTSSQPGIKEKPFNTELPTPVTEYPGVQAAIKNADTKLQYTDNNNTSSREQTAVPTTQTLSNVSDTTIDQGSLPETIVNAAANPINNVAEKTLSTPQPGMRIGAGAALSASPHYQEVSKAAVKESINFEKNDIKEFETPEFTNVTESVNVDNSLNELPLPIIVIIPTSNDIHPLMIEGPEDFEGELRIEHLAAVADPNNPSRQILTPIDASTSVDPVKVQQFLEKDTKFKIQRNEIIEGISTIITKAITEGSVMSPKDIKFLTQAYENLKETKASAWTDKEEDLINTLNTFIESKKIPKLEDFIPNFSTYQKHYNLLYANTPPPQTETQRIIREYLCLESRNVCYTPAQYQDKIDDCIKGIEILQHSASLFSDAEIIQLFYKNRIHTYPDAVYKEYPFNHSQKEGEGMKLNTRVYDIIDKFPEYFYTPAIQLTPEQFEKALEDIKQQSYIAGISNRLIDPNAVTLSGIDLHTTLVIQDPSDKNYYLIFSMFTSSKDPNTIQLSPSQVFNSDPNESNKPQMFRSCKRFMRIPVNSFEENKEATSYSKDEVISEKIISHVSKNIDPLCTNPVTEPVLFTRKLLTDVAQKVLQEDLEENIRLQQKVEAKLNAKLPVDKQREIENLNNKELKDLQRKIKEEYLSSLPLEIRRVIDIEALLERQKKQHQVLQEKENRHQNNMKEKYSKQK